MFRLLLLRHAKTERGAGGRDHDRELTDRGRRDAALIGRFLARAELVPELVVSSTATRARDTARLAIEAGRFRAPLRETPALYECPIERALDLVRSLDDRVSTVLMVGHEPTWSALASILAGGGRLRLPTAGLAYLEFGVESWSETTPGSAELRGLVTPALLGGVGED
jgi:phosphohistidine phosphatase